MRNEQTQPRELTSEEIEWVAGGFEEQRDYGEAPATPDFSYMTTLDQFTAISSMSGFQPDWRDLIPPAIQDLIEGVFDDSQITVTANLPPAIDLGGGYVFIRFADGVSSLYKDGVRIGNFTVESITVTDADGSGGGGAGPGGVNFEVTDRDGAVWVFRPDPRR